MNNDLKGLVPDWFSLDKYAIKKDFDLFDYFLNLQERLMLAGSFWFIGEFSKEIKKTNSYEIIKNDTNGKTLTTFLNTIKTKPISKQSKEQRLNYLKQNEDYKNPPQTKAGNKKLQLNTRNIKSLSGYDIRNIDTYHHKTKDYDYEPLCVTQKSIDDYMVYLSLDMTAPDKQLINDFKTVLSEMRKLDHLNYKKGKKITKLNLETWNKFNILEYIDLSIWYSINKIQVTDNQMGQILFPDEINKDTTEIIRKSTRKIVDEISTMQFMDMIYQQLINDSEKYLKVE